MDFLSLESAIILGILSLNLQQQERTCNHSTYLQNTPLTVKRNALLVDLHVSELYLYVYH